MDCNTCQLIPERCPALTSDNDRLCSFIKWPLEMDIASWTSWIDGYLDSRGKKRQDFMTLANSQIGGNHVSIQKS